jgi:hypothetical protein
MRGRVSLAFTVAALLCASGSEQRTYEAVGKDIQKVDLVPIVYQEARKDFDSGVIHIFNLEISFGDLSGDGNEEAVVTVFCRGAPMSSLVWDDFYLYALRDGKPTLIYKGESGDRAHGGICETYICSPDSIQSKIQCLWRQLHGSD